MFLLPLRLHRDHIVLLRREFAFLESKFPTACSPLLDATEQEDEKADEGDSSRGGIDGNLCTLWELAPFLREGLWRWFVGFLGEVGSAAVEALVT